MAIIGAKKCPHCHGKSMDYRVRHTVMGRYWESRVVCDTCRAWGPLADLMSTSAKAKAKSLILWNRRGV